jgi:hypothetical protein
MTDHLVTPDSSITVGGQTYTLDGSFKTLKDIQHATDQEIIIFTRQLARARFDVMAKVIEIGIRNAKQTPPPIAAIEQAIVEDLGIEQTRIALYQWLAIAATAKAERKKKADEIAGILAETSQDSLGKTTSE